jgi:hypothetical protein
MLAPFYSDTGRPSTDPELLNRMLIARYCYGIRAERPLCEEIVLKSPIACSAGSISMTKCRTIQPFPGADTSAVVRTCPPFG